MALEHSDQGVLLAAVLLAIGSGTWFLARPLPRLQVDDARPAAPWSAGLAETDAVPNADASSDLAAAHWTPPPAQSRGEGWVFGLFTPPSIERDPATGRFVLQGRLEATREARPAGEADSFGLTLLDVGMAPFRLQLVGYVGAEGAQLGVFENPQLGETYIGNTGRTFEKLDLEIVSFAVERRPVALGDGTVATLPVARAIVRDTRTGESHVLTDREPLMSGIASATVIATEGDGRPGEVRAGDRFRCGSTIFRIDRIELAPPSIEVTKVHGQFTESRRLESSPGAMPASPATL